MKYNEIIHINEDFIPVFDLENEKGGYWSYFIPNNSFKHLLRAVLDSLNTKNPKNPIWLQGTYGTGKSHATSVIKHLLCDENVFKSFELEDSQLTAKLKSFREKNKVFPIILKGTSTIGDSRRFTFTIQSAVKKALKENNMNISVPSEYENMVSILSGGIIDLKEEYLKNTTLEAYGKSEIINRLKNEESEILIELENILMDKGLSPLTQEDIHQWLINVKKELKKEYEIDYLMIFWDEFTGALNLPNVDEILLQIQNIAESKNEGVSLFIVSHKTRTNQSNINQETIEKVMDRFERINYTMEPIATYELMSKSINREPAWEIEKNRFIGKLQPLIEQISENDSSKVKKALENLYPIHPYTAYLATFIAREIGSTERSIFKFLHDDSKYGFKNFINTFDIDERYFLTSDYLWDFFMDDFEQIDDEKVNSSIQKFNMHHSKLEKKGIEYVTIFKVILLLNILFKMVELTEGSLAIPSKENIFNVFIGSIYETKVEKVLDFIDKQGIINKNPEDIFELTSNSLPSDLVSNEKDKLKQNLKLTDLLDKEQKDNIKNFISKKLNREMNLEFIDANIRENNLIARLEKSKGNPAFLQMYLFLCQNSKEFDSIKKNITSIAEKGLLENKLMIISKASFDEEYLNKYLEYRANAIVAKKHNYNEESNRDEEYAKKILDSWINDIKQKYVEYYLNDINQTLLFSNFIGKINKKLSKKIFSKGLENIDETINNGNLWSYKEAKVLSEKYITAKNYDELIESLNGIDKNSTEIFNDNNKNRIIDNKLNLLEDISDSHPLKLLQEFVDKKLHQAQPTGKFNLGDVLKPLTMAPYGYYPNILNIAAISFVLRKYVNKLYDSDGQPINETKMKNKVIPLFNYWQKGKNEQDLFVRFGSEFEKKLIELLNDVFNLKLDDEKQSITYIRWAIREWIKNHKTPLWLFEYSDNMNENSKVALNSLNDLLKPDDPNIPDELIQDCFIKLEPVKFDFKLFLKNNKEQLFENFIISNYNNINSERIPEIIKYIINRMPEEVNNWEQSDVLKEITNWVLESREREERERREREERERREREERERREREERERREREERERRDREERERRDREERERRDREERERRDREERERRDREEREREGFGGKPSGNDILNKIKKMDPNEVKSILIHALEEHHEIQTILDDYLEN